ncbi:MAG: nucleotide exchange factor GrpE [Planctomycetota bacterium]|nr:nucleotide exchange factor GrpE [Planctomycetota bacterium]
MTKKKHKHEQDDVTEELVQADESADTTARQNDLLARLQRVSADYLNYQKRAAREIADARRFANAELVKELLAVLDDMERALDHAAEDDPLSEGMKLVHDKAMEILGRHGLTPIAAEGESFDPQRHEAMMTEPVEGFDTPTVLRELQRGYEFRGRVLRPTRVVISATPTEDDSDREQ